MAEMGWFWRDRAFAVPAPVVGAAMERLGGKGAITPGALVDDARPEDSPLHPLFEWDDSVAGESYRRVQSRAVIRAIDYREIKVEVVSAPRPPAYSSLRVKSEPTTIGGTERGYVKMADVQNDPALKRQNVLREWAQLKGLIDRTAYIPEFAPIRIAAAKVEIELFSTVKHKAS